MSKRSLQPKLSFAVLLLLFTACGSSSGKGGTGAAGGGQSSGTGGAGGIMVGGGTGGSASFTAVEPCAAASDYVAGGTISFPNADVSYSPKCLKVSAGDEVMFTGDFAMHPLEGSRRRGDTADNPITTTMTGSSRPFTFATSGFFAYYCRTHGASDDGTGMAGIVWVQ